MHTYTEVEVFYATKRLNLVLKLSKTLDKMGDHFTQVCVYMSDFFERTEPFIHNLFANVCKSLETSVCTVN